MTSSQARPALRYLQACGNFGCAQLSFVMPIATGASWLVIEFTSYLEPTTALIVPGVSRPSLSTNLINPGRSLVREAVGREP